jgi:hypothetical protein
MPLNVITVKVIIWLMLSVSKDWFTLAKYVRTYLFIINRSIQKFTYCFQFFNLSVKKTKVLLLYVFCLSNAAIAVICALIKI